MSSAKRAHSSVVIIGREGVKSGRFTDVFRDVRLPNGSSAKVMNREVFTTATGAANRKLEEVVVNHPPDRRK